MSRKCQCQLAARTSRGSPCLALQRDSFRVHHPTKEARLTIKMYWWPGGGRRGNFGDRLGPALVQALTQQPIEHVPIHQADLIAIGSMLEPWFWPDEGWKHYRGRIWGSGRMFGVAPIAFPQASIHAVRGELTRQTLGIDAKVPVTLGDPGLLVGLFYERSRRPRYKLGVWPHWSEYDHPAMAEIRSVSPEIVIIDPCAPVVETIKLASTCEAIASSSLHGIVVADSLGIPNCQLGFDTGQEDYAGKPEFKYADYCSGLSSERPSMLTWAPHSSIDDLLQQASSSRQPELSKVQRDLIESFPFPIRRRKLRTPP